MPQFGGFWRRFLAYFIDAIIINVATSIVGGVIGVGIGMGALSGAGASNMAALETISGLTGALIGLVGSWLYSALLESSSYQATPGKMALGLVVTDAMGQRISFGRATGRYFAKILSSLILLIGFFMIGWTARKQGLHDMIAGTLVYKARSPQEVGVSIEAFR
jgi:uncharacterized RDD family membrane protein YckC